MQLKINPTFTREGKGYVDPWKEKSDYGWVLKMVHVVELEVNRLGTALMNGGASYCGTNIDVISPKFLAQFANSKFSEN